VLLDLYSAKDLKIVATSFNNQFIICPDNGILSLITQSKPATIVALPTNQHSTFLSITAVIAEAVSGLINGKALTEVGTIENNIVEKTALHPTTGPNWIDGQILFVDHFENVIINITKAMFEEQCKGRSFKIIFKRNESINGIGSNYASVTESEKVAFLIVPAIWK